MGTGAIRVAIDAMLYVATIAFFCAVSLAHVRLQDRTDDVITRKDKYVWRRRKLAKEYRHANRRSEMIETESMIMLPSETFFSMTGVFSAIAAEALVGKYVKDMLVWLRNTARDPFEFAYVEPILVAIIALVAYAIAKTVTARIAMSSARTIADRRIQKGRTARFDCDCGIAETIERAGAGVASWFTGANGRREKAEDVASADTVD